MSAPTFGKVHLLLWGWVALWMGCGLSSEGLVTPGLDGGAAGAIGTGGGGSGGRGGAGGGAGGPGSGGGAGMSGGAGSSGSGGSAGEPGDGGPIADAELPVPPPPDAPLPPPPDAPPPPPPPPDAATPSPDSGPEPPAPTPDEQACGTMSCDLDNQVCCASALGATCQSRGSFCTGAVRRCDDPEDCDGERICCARQTSVGGYESGCVQGRDCLAARGEIVCHPAEGCELPTHQCQPRDFSGVTLFTCR